MGLPSLAGPGEVFRAAIRSVGTLAGLSICFFASCSRAPSISDEDLMRALVGTWVTDEADGRGRVYTENNFHRDGMHSADQILHDQGETTRFSYDGTWDVHGGKLTASGQVSRSDSSQISTYLVEETIESLTASELVLVDSRGTRLVRHRKH